ncbi:hypothetical protein [Promicromonospora sp. NFX87]|uniref:hypothetical protein n=1 Tax=Promicromonospora sp. NFX87 TaxID=3402691 RepID=UPI003AFB7EFA
MRIARTQDDLNENLQEQLDFIREDGERFDAGNPQYAKRIATSIRILVHETGASHALLGQLGKLNTLRYLDTAGQFIETNMLATINLAFMRGTVVAPGVLEPSYVPFLDDYQFRTRLNRPTTSLGTFTEPAAGRYLQFEDWWNMTVVCDSSQTTFSRKDLVTALANQDGGAHVDPALKHTFHRLSRSNSLGMSVGSATEDGETPLGFGVAGGSPNPGEIAFGNPVLACVRQIGHELLRSVPRPGGHYRGS